MRIGRRDVRNGDAGRSRAPIMAHFESTCYYPLLLFNREGDCLAAKLRPGNVHSAEGWDGLLLPEIKRQQQQGKEVVFPADAAFAKPEIYEALEARDVKYAIRLPANDNLERYIIELLTRPVGSRATSRWFGSRVFCTRRPVGRRRESASRHVIRFCPKCRRTLRRPSSDL
jgi:Transposase DDE domain group 1